MRGGDIDHTGSDELRDFEQCEGNRSVSCADTLFGTEDLRSLRGGVLCDSADGNVFFLCDNGLVVLQ